MQDRRVRRRWGATLVGSIATLALAAGCTGDEGVQVVTDDVDGAAALAEAVGETPTSGRFRQEMTMDTADPSRQDEDWSMHVVADGEFVGDDVRYRMRSDFGGQEMDGESLLVGGQVFNSASSMLDSFDVPGDDDIAAALTAQRAALEAELVGKDWVQSPAAPADPEGVDGGLGSVLGGDPTSLLMDPVELLDDLDEVRELDPVDRDGESMRRFVGVVGRDSIFGPGEADDADSGVPAEEQARIDRIDDYAWSRTESSVEVLVGPDGFIRRVHLEIADDIEERYRGCAQLMDQGSMSMTVELFDLGAPIEIVAPDPSTVIALSELGAATPLGVDDPSGGALSPTSLFGRELAEQMLRDGAALIGLDPATIGSLSDDEVDAAIDRIEAAEESLPTFDTRIGPQNRLEMIETIRMGTTMLGIEPLDLSGYSDQQLADLINSYLDEYGFEFGTGDGSGDDEELDEDYDLFEGCPT